jgi:uncharacterized membrane protein YccC
MSSKQRTSNRKSIILKRSLYLLELNEYNRPIGFLATFPLAVGIPIMLGVYFGNFALGAEASIGGLVSLYLLHTNLSNRLARMVVVSFGFCSSFIICLLAGFHPLALVAAIGFVAFWATFICRYFSVPPPGSFFFIMVACIATSMEFDLTLLAERSGILLLGSIGAITLALIYSLIQISNSNTEELHEVECNKPNRVAIFLDSVTIAIFVSISYLLALLLGFENPYWAPISCAAILQGANFSIVKLRNVHRILGTAIGMVLTWGIFSLEPSPWVLAFLIIILCIAIELLITRNYGFAVIFITPFTIIIAESTHASMGIDLLIFHRMTDVVLGSIVGCLGGWFLYQKTLYNRMEQTISRWLYKSKT